jgi:hypothetical protein
MATGVMPSPITETDWPRKRLRKFRSCRAAKRPD